MKKIALLIASTSVLMSCSAPDEATRVLESSGFKNVEITGYKIWGCSKDDTFHTGFVATSPNGSRVEGVVCSGLLKGATIRF